MVDLKKEQVVFSNKIIFGIGSIGKEIVFGVTSASLFLYSIQVLNLSAIFLILLFLSCTLITSFFDPVFGYILDHINAHTPFSKYKVMVFWGLITNVCSLLTFYLPSPDIPSATNQIYIAFGYLLWSLSFSMLDIPMWAIIASFNTTARSRNTLSTIPCISRHLGLQCALLLVINVFKDHTNILSSTQENYFVTLGFNIFLLILCISSFLILLKNYSNKDQKKKRSSYVKRLFARYIAQNNSNERYQHLGFYNHAYNKRVVKRPPLIVFYYKKYLKTYYRYVKQLNNLLLKLKLTHKKDAEHNHYYSHSIYHNANPYAQDIQSNLENGSDTQVKINNGLQTQVKDDAFAFNNHFYIMKQNENSVASNYNYYQNVPEQPIEDWRNVGAAQRYQLYPFNNTSTAPWYNTNINKHSIRDLYKIDNYEEISSKLHPNLNKSYANMVEHSQTVGSNQATLANLDDSLPKEFKEHAYKNTFHSQKTLISVSKVLHCLVKNDQLLVLFLTNLLLSVTFHISYGATFFYCLEENLFYYPQIYIIIIVGSIMQVGSMITYPFVHKYLSISKVFISAIATFLLGTIGLLFIPSLDSPLLFGYLLVNYALISIGISITRVALVAQTADTVDYGEFKQSLRLDGVIFSLHTMTNRFCSALSLFIYGNAFFVANYTIDNLDQYANHANATFNLKIAVFMIMVAVTLAMSLYINYYKLNGAFYRNILNNIQFLRQNQKPQDNTNLDKNSQNFRLRYSLDSSTMIIKLKAKSIDEVLKAMVQKLSEVNAISSEYDYMCDLKARLKEGSCGIAEGIAMPHAKSNAVRRATVVVATLDTPLDMGALDNQDCDLVFLLASPDDGYTHLNLLGRLSLLLNEPDFANKLRTSGSPTELFERLIQCEKHIIR